MKKFAIISVALVLCFAFALCGCKPQVHRCAVSGSVTLDGEPFPTGRVNFIPENSDPTVGVVGGSAEITDGHYEIPAKPNGLMPGKYRVVVIAMVSLDSKGNIISKEDFEDAKAVSASTKDLVPPKYGSKSEMYVEIPNADKHTYDITMVKD